MAMDDRAHIRAEPIDLAMDESLEEDGHILEARRRFAVQIEFNDVIFGHQCRRQAARDQEAVRSFRMPASRRRNWSRKWWPR